MVNSWPDDWLWRALISQQGKPFMAEDGQSVAWDNAVGKPALDLARRFFAEGGMDQMEFAQGRPQFAAGLTGFGAPPRLTACPSHTGQTDDRIRSPPPAAFSRAISTPFQPLRRCPCPRRGGASLARGGL
ncbi:hypothetical protein NBRC116599_22720 [Aquicoccus sp. SU-CL01552]